MEKCSYRDFGKKGGHYWYINDKTSWPTPISQHKDVYTANAHTIWCEQADNLSLCYFLKLNFGVVRKFTRKLS